MSKTTKRHLTLGLYLLVGATFLAAYLASDLSARNLLDAARLTHLLGDHPLLVLGLFMGACMLTVFLALPTNVLFYLLAGYLFGPLEGALVAGSAVTLGSLAVVAFYRYLFRDFDPARIRRLLPGNLSRLLLLLRLSPVFPAPLINLLCAALRMRLPAFALSTFFGSLPLILVYTAIAGQLESVQRLEDLYSGQVIGLIVLLTLMSLIGLSGRLGRLKAHLSGVVGSHLSPYGVEGPSA